MKLRDIESEEFYWVNRQYIGLTIGLTSQRDYLDGGELLVTFPGTSKVFEVGKPGKYNPTRIEPRRFVRKVK